MFYIEMYKFKNFIHKKIATRDRLPTKKGIYHVVYNDKHEDVKYYDPRDLKLYNYFKENIKTWIEVIDPNKKH